jgi:hypothetical protein
MDNGIRRVRTNLGLTIYGNHMHFEGYYTNSSEVIFYYMSKGGIGKQTTEELEDGGTSIFLMGIFGIVGLRELEMEGLRGFLILSK